MTVRAPHGASSLATAYRYDAGTPIKDTAMPTTVKYHRDIHLPAALENAALTELVKRNGQYELTKHAAERIWGWRIDMPAKFDFFKAQVVEVTTVDGKLQKFLFRHPLDAAQDLCVSYTVEGRVATVFLNRKDDKHRTLRTEEYAKAA